ncbi:DUF2188 domain-containing protein [Pseudomonas yamanorum]|uniref:DUF2188 domain-containing protein n=1 Tax=Pseudomonas yamanorum TaxID=515393 RepID=UPI003B9FCF5D
MKTKDCWGLFRAGSVKPLAVASTKKGLVELAAPLIAGAAASVRVHNENGTFQELRF